MLPFKVTSQKVRASMGKGDELFPESLIVRNGFLATGEYDNHQGAFAY